MCLGIPARVLRSEGLRAWCADRRGERWIDTLLTGPVAPGTWLLLHLDIAREVIDADRASEVNAALDALDAAAAGASDFDAFFADLAGREPQLPDHLKPEHPRTDAS